MNNFSSTLAKIESQGRKRTMRAIKGPQGPRCIVDDKEALNFCSNNYLGLADDIRLIQAAHQSMEREGFGAGASRLISGNMESHVLLEQRIKEFKQTEAALIFSTGYMANVGIISGLFGRDDIVFADRLNHASIWDGIQLSHAQLRRFRHNDILHLRELLTGSEVSKRKVIIVDSVYSMDGDVAPLKEITTLAKEFGCLVMIDEAHGFGVFGKKGKGLAEYLGVDDNIDIQMGTFSKAAGCFGAYCCGSKELIDVLLHKVRSFVYTTALPPSVAASCCEAINIIENEPARRKCLWDNADYLREELKRVGFDTCQSSSAIIPVVIGDEEIALTFSRLLLESGVFISAIRPPTVPDGTSRLRLTVMATHTKEELKYVVESMKVIGKELKII